MIMRHSMMTNMFPLSHPVAVEHCAVYRPVVAPLEHLVTNLQQNSIYQTRKSEALRLTCMDRGDAS